MVVFYTSLKTESFFNCYPLIAILVQSCIKVGILRFHYRKNSFFNAHVRFNAVLTWLISNSISIYTYVQKCKASNKWYVPTNWEPYSHSSKPKGPNNPLCMLGLFGCNAERSTCIGELNQEGSVIWLYYDTFHAFAIIRCLGL